MNYPSYFNQETRELFDAISLRVVPAKDRKPVYQTNCHVPHYSQGRYKRVA